MGVFPQLNVDIPHPPSSLFPSKLSQYPNAAHKTSQLCSRKNDIEAKSVSKNLYKRHSRRSSVSFLKLRDSSLPIIFRYISTNIPNHNPGGLAPLYLLSYPPSQIIIDIIPPPFPTSGWYTTSSISFDKRRGQGNEGTVEKEEEEGKYFLRLIDWK